MHNVPVPWRHAEWCDAPAIESHAVCRWHVATVELTDGQSVTVALHQSRHVAPIITAIHRVGGRETLIALNRTTGRELATAIATAVQMLH